MIVKPKPGDRLLSSLFGVRDKSAEEKQIADIRAGMLEIWRDPIEWLNGVDPTTTEMVVDGVTYNFPGGRPLIWTADEKDKSRPIKPFPTMAEKPYLYKMAREFLDNRLVMTDKARQMLITTLCLLLLDHMGKFQTARRFLVSRTKEDDATELLRDKIRKVHLRLPQWVQDALPMAPTPMNRIDYEGTGSYIRGVSQNVAFSEARGGTATVMLIDEAAFQDLLGEILAASLPMAGQVWMITTAYRGNRGAEEFYKRLNEGKKEVQ